MTIPSIRPTVRALRFVLQSQGAPSPLAPIDGLCTFQEYVVDRRTLFTYLDTISRQLAEPPRIPCFLHIIAHGTAKGIAAGNDFVTWTDLKTHFASLNAACGNKLVLIMSSCQGIHAISMASQSILPFTAVIGALDEVEMTVNADWHAFYMQVVDGKSWEDAFAIFKKDRDEDFFKIDVVKLRAA